RLGWNGQPIALQVTYLDNRSDGLEYGQLYNWDTRFTIVSAEYTTNDWTIAAESGWGPTIIVVPPFRFTSDLEASYLLISRRLAKGRASLRADLVNDGETESDAITLAYLWTARPRMRAGVEVTAAEGDVRLLVEIRYSFSGR
ncbi:MAG TPA: hypothetical protein VIL97_04270, partial [Thermoanaerobaculia bacterium]